MAEEKKQKVEIVEIPVTVHDGNLDQMVVTRKYCKVNDSLKVRFDCNIKVPESDEEAKLLYGLSLDALLRKGVIQASYDERELQKLFEDPSFDPESAEAPKLVADTLKPALVHVEKERKVSAAKQKAAQLELLYRKYGLSPEDGEEKLIEAIQKATTEAEA